MSWPGIESGVPGMDLLRITPQSLFIGPPDQSTWMFTWSLIQEWPGRVFWYAAWRHYANGLLASCAITVWPCCVWSPALQHTAHIAQLERTQYRSTIPPRPRHRALDVFLGSCYTYLFKGIASFRFAEVSGPIIDQINFSISSQASFLSPSFSSTSHQE